MYDNLANYQLPYPEAIFDIQYYTHTSTKPFVALAGELWPGLGKYAPTLTHTFLALLHQHGLLLRSYTQNIDGLEALAGVPDDKLVECHGHFRTASCTLCGKPYDGNECQDAMVVQHRVPLCTHTPRCRQNRTPEGTRGGAIKPVRRSVWSSFLHFNLRT